ncbi:MAG: hypothetical protein ACK56F_06245 [bacterium]
MPTHPTVALFPPYRERALISPQRRRTVAVAKSCFLQGRPNPSFLIWSR